MHPLHQSSLKDGQCKQSKLASSSPLATQTDNKARFCCELSQQLNPQGIAGKQLGASSPNVDSSHQSQLCNFKPIEMRVRKGLLAQYWPKISNEGSQQLSGRYPFIVSLQEVNQSYKMKLITGCNNLASLFCYVLISLNDHYLSQVCFFHHLNLDFC